MESESSKQIKRGALLSYVVVIFNMATGLIYTPWMISQIGQENYGLYTLATSLITMFTMDFGMSMAASRFLSKYIAEGNQEAANNLMGLVYKLYTVIDGIIFVALIVVYFFIDSIYSNLRAEEIVVFKNLYLIVGLYTVVTFPFVTLNGVLTSYEKYVPLKLCDLFYKIFVVGTVIVALSIGGNIYTLVSINAIGGLFSVVVKLIVIYRKTPIRPNFKFFNKETLREIFGFSVWTTITALAQRLIINITPTIIAAVSITGSIGVAIFGLGSAIEGYVFVFASALNGLFMPKVSRMVYQEHNKEGIMNLAIRVGRIQCMLTGLLVVGFIAVGKSFIVDIWNKPDFEASYICAVLLILPSYFHLPMEIMHTALVVENKVRLQSAIYTIMGLMNALISLVLSRTYGAVGASVSIFLAYTVRSTMMAYIYQSKLHFDMVRFFKETYLKISPALICVLGLGVFAERYNPISNHWLRFFVNGVIIVLAAVVLLYKFVMHEDEKNMIRNLI